MIKRPKRWWLYRSYQISTFILGIMLKLWGDGIAVNPVPFALAALLLLIVAAGAWMRPPVGSGSPVHIGDPTWGAAITLLLCLPGIPSLWSVRMGVLDGFWESGLTVGSGTISLFLGMMLFNLLLGHLRSMISPWR